MTSARFTATRPTPIPPMDALGAAGAAAVNAAPAAVVEVYGVPGSGKSSVLFQRFRHLVLKEGLRPEQVLVLAATRESAAALREQLLLGLAGNTEYAVEGTLARTISSLAFALVRAHALETGERVPELVSGPEQDSIFTRLLQRHELGPYVDLWPDQISSVTRGLAGFRAELRDLIAVCQELGISADDLAARSAEHPTWRAAASLYSDYEALLGHPEYAHKFDSPSLVNRAIDLLEQGAALPKFAAVLVDDAQELTPSAVRLLKQLVGEGVGLTLFGDPDASTLGFRQADPRLMANLAQEIALQRGEARNVIYLSDQAPSQAAGVGATMARVSALIGAEGAGGQRKVYSVSPEPTKPATEVHVWASNQAEAEWLAHTLRTLHLGGQAEPGESSDATTIGVPWSEMAIVARTRGQLDALERSLAALGLPVRISGAQQALRDEFASRELLELASFVNEEYEDNITAELAERLLRSPYCGLDSVAMRRLRRQLRRLELEAAEDLALARNSDVLLVELFVVEGSAATLRGPDATRIRSFLKSIAIAREIAQDSSASIEDLLWQLWRASGLEKIWSELSRGKSEIAIQANRNLDATVALFAAANRYAERNPGAGKTEFLSAQLEQALPEDSLSFGHKTDQFVNLLTPAGLVGKRFHTVAIPGLIEGIWPNLKPRGSLLGSAGLRAAATSRTDSHGAPVRSEMADELRMFYKAMGAANSRLLISSYLDEDEQVSQFVNHAARGKMLEAENWDSGENAVTLRALVGRLRRAASTTSDATKHAEAVVGLARLAQAGVAGAHPDDWYGLLEASTSDPLFEFVASALDADDQSHPDKGERITINPSQLEAFVKCPLHWFLNYHGASGSDFAASVGTLVHRAMELATSVDEATLWQQVESGWHTLRFESAWIEQAERRRAQKLVANLSQYLTKFAGAAGTVLAREQDFELDLGKAHIRGQVDRIELGANGKIMIVDLKTSKRIPSNEDALKHAQLGLYQLAYLNGAFEAVIPDEGEAEFAGAKLVLVSGDNPTIREQASVLENPETKAYFEKLVQDSAEGMAMPKNIFVANISSHCTVDSEYGTCQLHLTKAVSNAE